MSSDAEVEACGRFLESIRGQSAYPRIRRRIRAIHGQIMTVGVILILVGVIAFAMLVTAEGQRVPGPPVVVGVISMFAAWGVIEFAKYLRERMSMQVDTVAKANRVVDAVPVISAGVSIRHVHARGGFDGLSGHKTGVGTSASTI